MLVRSVLAPALILALSAPLANSTVLLFGGKHGPPGAVGGGGSGHGTGPGGGGTGHPETPKPSTGGDTAPSPGAGPRSGAPKGPKTPPAPAPKGPHSGTGATTAPPAAPPSYGAGPSTGPSVPTGGDATLLDPSWNIWWFFHEDEFLKYAEGPQTAETNPLEAQARAHATNEPVGRAIAALIERERSTEILTGALLGMVGVREPVALDALRKSLDSSTSRVRELSLIALGASGDEHSLDEFEALLRDDATGRKLSGERGQATPQRMRAHAAYALALVAERTQSVRTRQLAARALADVLTTDASASADLQVACALGLGIVPLPSAPGGARELDDKTPWVSSERMAACLADMLADKQRPETLRAELPCVLARLVPQADGRTRAEVAQAIVAQLQRGSAVSSGVREGCIMALGEIGRPVSGETDQKIQTALLQAAERGPEAERCFAWMALATLAAHDGDGENGASERAALRKRLVQGLGEVRARERGWIGLALGVLENRRARAGDREPALEVRAALRAAFVRATGPEEESGLALGLGLCGDLEGALLVGQRLQRNAQADLVGYELLAIGLAHDVSQRPLLRKHLTTSTDPVVVEHAAEALALIGDPELTSMLVAGAQANASLEARESHVLALSDIGDRTALEMLLTKLGDENQPPCMRAALSLALGGICEHGQRKWYTGLRTLANWRVSSMTLISDGQGVLEIG